MNKKIFILIIGLIFTCEVVKPSSFQEDGIKRCVNEEVICYVYEGYRRGGIDCFKK